MYGKTEAGLGLPVLVDSNGRLDMIAGGGRHQNAVLAGRMFTAANQAAVALTAAFATTYTGLVLENPTGSGKNLVLHELTYASTVATPTATALGLMTGADAGDAAAAITPRNRLKSASAVSSVAIVDNGCTLTGTPVLEQLFATAWTEATTAGTLAQPNIVKLDGSLIITPGYYVAIYSAAANTAAFLFSFLWEELDA
jgi:hypothetical protein